jgi:hypothetical protein
LLGIISDVMDELGIPAGVVGASTLADHARPGHLRAGTYRAQYAQRVDALAGARARLNKMGFGPTIWRKTATCW